MVLDRHETFWVELASGGSALSWGGYVVWFHAPLAYMPVYDVLAKHIPGWSWSWAGIVFGALQMCASAASLMYRQTPWWRTWNRWWRWWLGWGGLLWWKIMAVSMLNSGDLVPHAMVDCWLAFGNSVVIVLLRPGRRIPISG